MPTLKEYVKDKYDCTIKKLLAKHWLKGSIILQRWNAWRAEEDLLLPSKWRWWPRITKHQFWYDYKWNKCLYQNYLQRIRKGLTPEQAINPTSLVG